LRREQLPGALNALESVLTAILEPDPRTGNEVGERARNEHLTGS
jgi:hypothetical protein